MQRVAGFVFVSRQVELLGVKIMFFLRNVLPVLNFERRNILERKLKQLTKREIYD